ncbi:MAG: hypothetical protein JKY22_11095, partial [Flavobacteriaceae bacterium]|nr:hypothetical protein [Flavobacteriaceae bacterium]
MAGIQDELKISIKYFLMTPEFKLSDKAARKRILIDAFVYNNPALTDITIEGETDEFIDQLIYELDDYGCFDGMHGLERIIKTITESESKNIIKIGKELINNIQLQNPCKESSSLISEVASKEPSSLYDFLKDKYDYDDD